MSRPDDLAGAINRRPQLTGPPVVELRRGVGPWSGLAMAIALGIALVDQADELPGWQNSWRDVTDLLRPLALLVGGPISIAAGCWQGGRERRHGTGELLAGGARSPLRQALTAAVPSALWPAVGYLTAAAGALLAAWPYVGAWGRPSFSLIVSDACALASLGIVGFVVGRLAPWRLTAPALGGLVYLGFGTLSYTGARSWLNPAEQYFPRWDAPVWWYAPASIMWTGGLACAIFLVFAARRRAVALVPLTAAALAAALLTGEEGPWRPDPRAGRLVCDGGAPQVCVSARDRSLLPQVTAALNGANARLHGIPHAPSRWVSGPQRTRAGEAPLPPPGFFSLRGRLREPAEYANWAVGQLIMKECRSGGGDSASHLRAQRVGMGVVQWLAPSAVFDAAPWPEAKEHAARLHALPPSEQHAFLTRYLAFLSSEVCRPEKVPLP
ncbi:hypothetical protein ABZ348_03645 [Streptomyces sp. NPDC005963]|uniref:hypothetical protein n=1 Tax=Streptomyces sp. NPDC005963 TaxID=3156721 RepID=UPI0033D00591